MNPYSWYCLLILVLLGVLAGALAAAIVRHTPLWRRVERWSLGDPW